MTKIHNFPDKIKLVINKDNMAYIALDDSSLETGMSWAKGWWHNNYIPKVYNYDNGSFIFKLHSAADNSSQNGKLSFWTLEIGCPDGQVFTVGINAESLFQTLLGTTCVEGTIIGKFYIGRTDGQQAMASPSSEAYKEYLKQVEAKKQPLTKKYDIGTKIKNGRDTYVYLAEGKKILWHDHQYGIHWGDKDRRYGLVYDAKPSKPVYFYLSEGHYGTYVIQKDEKINGRIVEQTDLNFESITEEQRKYLQFELINQMGITDLTEIERLLAIENYYKITKKENV